ncbi:MAG: dienelactone hydrolase family protein [Sphingomonas sp.]|uniref:dienelactone hydrolase family protein n=1 Tax=Sphingomonas sp. TaxID=28214 RepID=UPI0018479A8B|nr:dienelactone hydrolase family protein [Sphingomonas sp.]MBA3667907.1 dienelactone hydrolase family protein [Sphingomonas sp.]
MTDQRQQAIELYDRFTHDGMDRRDFFARMTVIAGGAAAASSLIASIAASPAAATVIPANDKRLITRKGKLDGAVGLSGYVAARRDLKKAGVVIIVHENRGLNAHIEDVARRVARAGFYAVAPDFLTPLGGTPGNEDTARELIGKLDLANAVDSAVALGESLKRLRHSNGKLGIVGFCWGGAFVNRVAVTAGSKLDAGVAYYGPAPAPAEASRIRAPLLLHYAGLDTRVNQTGLPWVAALQAAGKSVESFNYAKVNHAFNNDTSAERYNKAAADLAWQRTIAFFRQHLK